jgi:hypothetical protein
MDLPSLVQIQPSLYPQNQPVQTFYVLILLYLFRRLPADLLLAIPGRQPRARSEFVDHQEFLEVHLIELHIMAFSMMSPFDSVPESTYIVQLTEMITKMGVLQIYVHSRRMHKLI